MDEWTALIPAHLVGHVPRPIARKRIEHGLVDRCSHFHRHVALSHRPRRHPAGREGQILMKPDELERRLQERLDALGPAPRAELLHVLILPDFERADRIGEFWSHG
jgi:hypothetical protein